MRRTDIEPGQVYRLSHDAGSTWNQPRSDFGGLIQLVRHEETTDE